jgi:hypothetical protein
LFDSGTSPNFAVGRNAIPSYTKMLSRPEWARPKITQLHLAAITSTRQPRDEGGVIIGGTAQVDDGAEPLRVTV